MSPGLKYDYRSLEEEFVRGTMSVRELARLHGISQSRVSSLHDQARKIDDKGRTWEDKRAEFQGRTTDLMIARMARNEADRRARHAQVQDHAIELIDQAISACERDLRATKKKTYEDENGETVTVEEPMFRILPKDVSILLDKLSTLMGVTTQSASLTITPEGRRLDVSSSGGPNEPPPAIAALARLAGIAGSRSIGADSIPMGRSSLPSAPTPSHNQ